MDWLNELFWKIENSVLSSRFSFSRSASGTEQTGAQERTRLNSLLALISKSERRSTTTTLYYYLAYCLLKYRYMDNFIFFSMLNRTMFTIIL